MYDYIIVGGGLYGATLARALRERGCRCLVLERRELVGGNIRDEIVNNVIMYAPVQDSAKTKEENKAVATEFYRIRDAINNVYHLDWLEKK